MSIPPKSGRKAYSLYSNKNSEFNILKFILIYFLLLYGFYAYIGITSEGGKLFSSFLSRYADFPGWITIVIAKASKLLLELAGYTVYQRNPSNITIAGGRGVTIAWACLGAGAISLWIAFITAHKVVIQYKIKWIISGITLICFINVLRIVTIALSYYYNWKYPGHFNAHTSFNMLTYAIILLLMFIFTRSFKMQKRKISASLV